jgi:hypothetical protein
MASGNGDSARTFVIFSLFGMVAVLSRATFDVLSPQHVPQQSEKSTTRSMRLLHRHPGFFSVVFLLSGAILLPRDPWKHMSSTILYDVISAISTTAVENSIRQIQSDCPTSGASQSLFASTYDPAKDPFYITNLDEPVIPWIADAIRDLNITNVVQIVLESVRADCYPFEENGLLHQHIRKKMNLAVGGVPITTENITPFIASLASNTILWNNTWSICPLTHKAMLGCINL